MYSLAKTVSKGPSLRLLATEQLTGLEAVGVMTSGKGDRLQWVKYSFCTQLMSLNIHLIGMCKHIRIRSQHQETQNKECIALVIVHPQTKAGTC